MTFQRLRVSINCGIKTQQQPQLKLIILDLLHAYLIQSPTVKGTFSFRIPLKHIFGYCDDYNKIVYGLKHSLTLVRKTDDDAIFRRAAAGAGKVSLDKISSFMPHFIPADAEKFSIYKIIESKVKLPVAYRTRQCNKLSVPELISFTWRLSVKTASEKPIFIIAAFQTAKYGDQTQNPSIFDDVNLKNAYVTLNSDRYPAVDYNLSFANQKFLGCTVRQPCLDLNSLVWMN